MADEQLILAAQVRDEFSAPIAQMARQLRTLVDQNQKGHLQGVAVSKLHTEAFMKLGESVHKGSEVFRREFLPVIEKLSTEALGLKLALGGVAGAAAAAASGAAAMAFNFAGGSQSIYDLAESTKVSINWLRQFEALGPRLGVSADQMAAAAKSYGASMDRLQTHPDAFGVGAAQAGMGADVTAWIRTLHGTREQVFDQIIKEAEGFKNQGTDYKRRFYDIFGLPPELANKSLAELEDYRTRVRGILKDMSPADEAGGRAANSALLDLKLRVQNLSDTIGAQLSPALRAAADAMGGFLANLTPAPGALDALNASVRALAADPKINDIFAMPDAQGAIGKLDAIVKSSQQLGGILDDLSHHKVDWAAIFNFTGMDQQWETFKKTWEERFAWIKSHFGVTIGGTTFGAPMMGQAPLPSGPPFSFRYDPNKWNPWTATAAPAPIEPPLHDRPPLPTTPAPGILERLKGLLPIAPAEAAPTAPPTPPPPIAPAAPAPFVLPKLGPFVPAPSPPAPPAPPPMKLELPTGPGAPPPSMPAFSPIAFRPGEPAGPTPGAGAGESSTIRIIAIGVRKGVYDGLYDFWQAMKAMTGAGAAAGGAGGVMPASYGGAAAAPRGGGALAGVTPGSPAIPAIPAVPPSGGAGIGLGGLGPGSGGHGGGAGLGIGPGARPGSPAIPGRPAAPAGTGAGGSYGYTPSTAPAGSLTKLIGDAAAKAAAEPGARRSADQIRQAMEGIRAGESGHGSTYDKKDDALESSWGPFQMNRRAGFGVQFEKDTAAARKAAGLGDLRDPRTMQIQADYLSKYLARGGSLAPWMGYHGSREADPSWKNSGLVPENATTPPKPLAGLATPAPTTAAPPSNIRLPNVYSGGQSSEYPAKGETSGSSPLHDRAAVAALSRHGEVLREMFGHRGPQKRPDVERLPLPGQQDVSLRPGDLGRRAELGSLWRESRKAEAEIHKVQGEASLHVKLAQGLAPVGGIKSKGDLFKKLTLDKAAMATASTVG